MTSAASRIWQPPAPPSRSRQPKPPPEKPQTTQRQLDTTDVEKALDQISISLPPGTYVEHHPTYKVIISNGITFILKPEL